MRHQHPQAQRKELRVVQGLQGCLAVGAHEHNQQENHLQHIPQADHRHGPSCEGALARGGLPARRSPGAGRGAGAHEPGLQRALEERADAGDVHADRGDQLLAVLGRHCDRHGAGGGIAQHHRHLPHVLRLPVSARRRPGRAAEARGRQAAAAERRAAAARGGAAPPDLTDRVRQNHGGGRGAAVLGVKDEVHQRVDHIRRGHQAQQLFGEAHRTAPAQQLTEHLCRMLLRIFHRARILHYGQEPPEQLVRAEDPARGPLHAGDAGEQFGHGPRVQPLQQRVQQSRRSTDPKVARNLLRLAVEERCGGPREVA
mmetsp:Transcript_87942/g.283969  ORF Transcript_87942/g.283969 Transcript_87942/m.283969 type:complete len:313 (+) Transcript_87942:1033-1971(+)